MYAKLSRKVSLRAGTIWIDKAVQSYVPFLGKRRCYVLPECPPVISVNEEIDDYGAVFIWTKEGGPIATLAGGTVVYLSTPHAVPMADGYVEAEISQGAETPTIDDYALFHAMSALRAATRA